MSERGMLIVISAPSGTGKSTVAHSLMQRHPEIAFSVSATTRRPREGERDGEDYFFVTRERFDNMVESGEFLEYATYAGNSYGTPRRPVEERLERGKDVLLDVDVQGADSVRRLMPEALLVFIMPPSFEELERRLVTRGKDSAETIALRLSTAQSECSRAKDYDYTVTNDEVERAVRELEDIISSEKARRRAKSASSDINL